MTATSVSLPRPTVKRFEVGRFLRRNAGGVTSGALVLLFAIGAVAAPVVAPWDPVAIDLLARLKPPVWDTGGLSGHLLGTDQLGRDLLSRIIYGARVSLTVSCSAVLVAVLIGLPIGMIAGYVGGLPDMIIQRLVEIQMALPFVLVAIILAVLLRPGEQSLIIILGITGWVQYGRLARVEVMAIKEREFVTAARALGATDLRIAVLHILPNLVPTLIVIGTIQLAQFILAEASLSFLGIGVSPETPSWGMMVNEGRDFVYKAPWLQTYPGLAIVLCVSAVGLLGNALRDRLDPRLRT